MSCRCAFVHVPPGHPAMTTASCEVASADAVVAPALFRLRPSRPGDEAFIRDSWRRAFEQDGERGRWPSLAEYIAAQNAAMSYLLPRSAVCVAVAPDDEDQIFGWSCVKRFADVRGRMVAVVHYLYVKRCFAAPEFGVRDALWDEATRGADLVYSTQLLDSTRPRVRWNPWMIFA